MNGHLIVVRLAGTAPLDGIRVRHFERPPVLAGCDRPIILRFATNVFCTPTYFSLESPRRIAQLVDRSFGDPQPCFALNCLTSCIMVLPRRVSLARFSPSVLGILQISGESSRCLNSGYSTQL